MEESSKKKSKRWILIIGTVAVLYVIGRVASDGSSNTVSTETTFKADAILPVRKVAGRTPKDVEALIGGGVFEKNWKDRRSGCTSCPKYHYRKDSIEIIYINGKADRITLNGLSNYSFDASLAAALGLPTKDPDFKNDNVMRWYNYEGLREVMAFNDGNGNVNYALIKTKAD